jgi:hypothetical protein
MIDTNQGLPIVSATTPEAAPAESGLVPIDVGGSGDSAADVIVTDDGELITAEPPPKPAPDTTGGLKLTDDFEAVSAIPPCPGPGMIFRDDQRLTTAWNAAAAILGENCRIVTMADLAEILLTNGQQHEVWRQTMTTNTGIYIGPAVDGELVAVVGHGVGPLSRPDILLPGSAADHGWVPLPEADWQELLCGAYGPVAVVPLRDCPPPRSDSVHEPLSQLEAIQHPLVREIFGVSTGALFRRLYDLAAEAAMAMDMFSKFEGGPQVSRPLVGLRDLIRSARRQLQDDGRPCGRLLTLSGLDIENSAQPLLEIGYHLDGQPVRLIAAKSNGRITAVHRGPQAVRADYRRRLPDLFEPCPMLADRPAVWALTRFEGIWFTCQRRQAGELADSDVPEFACKQVSPRLATVSFRTTTKDREDGLACDQRVLAAVCRKHNANAYQLQGPIRIEQEAGQAFHVTRLDLYRVAVRTTARFTRWDELATDWSRLLKL